jgi:hypothetical protein
MHRNFRIARLVTGLVFVAAAPAMAQSWPATPVKLVQGYPAGGGADILARLVAEAAGRGARPADDRRESHRRDRHDRRAIDRGDGNPTATRCCSITMNMCCTSPVMPGQTR